MGAHKFISWTPFKKRYDKILVGLILTYLLVFVGVQLYLYPNTLPPLIIIKPTGTLAIIMLFFILSIGPLSRLDKRFLPVLYNRRHLGVSMFIVSLVHGGLSLIFFHGFGNVNPIESLFTSNTNYFSLKGFPFMVAGFFALIYLLFMAITSHDYWNNKLTAQYWKAVHMGVYIVFGLIMLHVFSGLLQGNTSPITDVVFISGFATVIVLHVLAMLKVRKQKSDEAQLVEDGYLLVGALSKMPDMKAKIVCGDGRSIAVFREGNNLHAIDNYCQHQGGPLGEGKIIDGCVTCPWHGYQYIAKDGKSPPPFEEKVNTYNLKISGDQLFVSSSPNPLDGVSDIENQNINLSEDAEFFVGYRPEMPKGIAEFLKKVVTGLSFLVIGLAVLMPHALEPMNDSKFNFAERVVKKGIVSTSPVPMLTVEEEGVLVDYLLVSAGKFTAMKTIIEIEDVQGIKLDGREVEISATEISYDNKSLLELTEGLESIVNIGDSKDVSPSILEGSTVDLKGEIVDPKCFFGSMNPATGKLHKSCAIRCLLGGIPAMLAAESDGETTYYIILGGQGQSINEQLIDIVSEDISLSGRVAKINNWNYLYLDDPKEIKRLSYRNILNNKKDVLCGSM